jgi:hypothetical protein
MRSIFTGEKNVAEKNRTKGVRTKARARLWFFVDELPKAASCPQSGQAQLLACYA